MAGAGCAAERVAAGAAIELPFKALCGCLEKVLWPLGEQRRDFGAAVDPADFEELAHRWVLALLDHLFYLKVAPSGLLGRAEQAAVASKQVDVLWIEFDAGSGSKLFKERGTTARGLHER